MGARRAISEVFAANRAVGRASLAVAATEGGTVRTHVHEAGSLRLRFPNGQVDGTLDAVIVNTAGGMTGGDRFDFDIKVGAEAKLAVTTAAAEKIYRSLGPLTEIAVKLGVGRGGKLIWLPQETILFDQIRLQRTIDVTMASGAGLLLSEATVFGRGAMGEAVHEGHFFDRRRVRVDGRLVFAETIGLDGNITQRLAQRAVTRAGVAIGSVLKIPVSDQDTAAMRSIQDSCVGEVGISIWNGFALARLVARDGATLHHDLGNVLEGFGVHPLPRLWFN
jgi:urease accessory protein